MTGRLLPGLVALLALLGWWALSQRVAEVLLPSPWQVAEAAWDQRSRLAEATLWTARSAGLGLAAAAAVGFGGAVAFLRSRWLEVALYPYAVLLQTVPVVAVAPLLLVWLGYGPPVAAVTAAMVSFFPLLTAANLGLRAPSTAQLELLRLHGATWWQTLWLLRLPAALPFLFAGLRTAVGLAVIGAIVGEFVASNGDPPCLGNLVVFSARSARTATTFAAIACATVLALGAFGLVRWLEARVIGPWYGAPDP